jgi:MSHA pilin protein MshA
MRGQAMPHPFDCVQFVAPRRVVWGQRGFTMIELIVVIVILGILAVTALPKFIDLSGDAKAAALKGMAGTADGAMAMNYAGCSATGHAVAAGKCVKVDTCGKLGSLLLTGLPSEYTVVDDAISTTNGVAGNCTLVQQIGGAFAATQSATFRGIAAGN